MRVACETPAHQTQLVKWNTAALTRLLTVNALLLIHNPKYRSLTIAVRWPKTGIIILGFERTEERRREAAIHTYSYRDLTVALRRIALHGV